MIEQDRTMLEVIAGLVGTLILGIATGSWTTSTTLGSRQTALELKVAERYITREELEALTTRLEGHMVRVEEKIDHLSGELNDRLQA